MAKPVGFRHRWRARWTDEHGRRRSVFFDKHSEAVVFLREPEVEVAQVRRGVRAPDAGDKLFTDLCDEWIANRLRVVDVALDASPSRLPCDDSSTRQGRPADGSARRRDHRSRTGARRGRIATIPTRSGLAIPPSATRSATMAAARALCRARAESRRRDRAVRIVRPSAGAESGLFRGAFGGSSRSAGVGRHADLNDCLRNRSQAL